MSRWPRVTAIIGCNPQSGRPLPGKLMELDLEWVEALLGTPPEA